MLHLGYCLMEKLQNILYKDRKHFVSKERFLLYPTLTNLTQKMRKTCDANNVLAISLVNIIVYIYYLRKNIFCAYLNTIEHEMVLPHVKVFNKKMHKQLVKIRKKKKKRICERFNQEKTNLFW